MTAAILEGLRQAGSMPWLIAPAGPHAGGSPEKDRRRST
jgi:hypothetical protein